jgi:hypothetical protein
VSLPGREGAQGGQPDFEGLSYQLHEAQFERSAFETTGGDTAPQ